MKKPTISAFSIILYRDNMQTIAHCHWSDGTQTAGDPKSTHMQQLQARAEREGITIKREAW